MLAQVFSSLYIGLGGQRNIGIHFPSWYFLI